MIREVERGHERLHPALPYCHGEVHWAGRREMARTVSDVLVRRIPALYLNRRAALAAAPAVAGILAREPGRDAAWEADQVEAMRRQVEACLPAPYGSPISGLSVGEAKADLRPGA